MDKEQSIRYIKASDPFYEFADLSAHSLEQLEAIEKRIRSNKSGKINKRNQIVQKFSVFQSGQL